MQTLLPAQGITQPDGAIISITSMIDYTPAPVKPEPTIFGNVPRFTQDAAGVLAADTFYQQASKVMRWYCTDVLKPISVAQDRMFIGSFKTMPAALVGPAPLGFISMAASYGKLICIHEVDAHDAKDPNFKVADWQLANAAMLGWGVTNLGIGLTGWCFDPTSKRDPNKYMVKGVNHLCVDFDGISTSYHNWIPAIEAAAKFAKDRGMTVGAGELNWNQQPNDKTGTGRASALRDAGQALRENDYLYGCWWENEPKQPGSSLVDPAEQYTLSTMMAMS